MRAAEIESLCRSAESDRFERKRWVRQSDYPFIALQQLLRNATMHRSYEGTNSPVRLYWFSDRVEIHSPGGPFGAVTVQNFGQPGVTDYRNPLLADNGNAAPRFETNPQRVLVTVEAVR